MSLSAQAKARLGGIVGHLYPERRKPDLSLKEFMLGGWHVLEPSTEYVDNWHIDAITAHLEAVSAGELRRLVINLPPRCQKSLLVSVFWPCWEWHFRPELRFLFSSYAAHLSKRDSLKCRRLLESPWYRRNWGNRFAITTDANSLERFENDKTGFRIATSPGGLGTGEGGNRVCMDDPHKADSVESDAIRGAVLEWWSGEMSTRLNNPTKDAYIVVAQRTHEADLCGHVLAQEGWTHLCLPMRWEGERYVSGWRPKGAREPIRDPRTQHGELLWPARVPEPEVARMESDLGSYRAAGQLQQRPAPPGGLIFQRTWWRFWQPEGKHLGPVMLQGADGVKVPVQPITLPDTFDQQIQSWDCAFKDTKQSDFVCGQVWGGKGADRFLLTQRLERLAFSATVAAVEKMSGEWEGARTVLVEDKANGSAVIDTLKSKVSGLIPVEPQGGKEARAHAVSPQVESGNVYLPHPTLAPWVWKFIETCASFPKCKNDDEIDAMTQALIRMRKGRQRPPQFATLGRGRPMDPEWAQSNAAWQQIRRHTGLG